MNVVKRWASAGLFVALCVTHQVSAQAPAAALDAALAGFWKAESPDAAADAARAVLGATQDFDVLLARLKAGRPYEKAATGVVLGSRTNSAGVVHPYFFVVPAGYDPAKKYPVRFFLHGAVARGAWAPADVAWFQNYSPLLRDDTIFVFPASWNESRWWEPRQIENLGAILDSLKRRYNVDENRVYMLGISDGGTGAYYHAMLAPTIWAAYAPLNGQPAVLANVASPSGASLYAGNLVRKPFYIVHGALDRLYPIASVAPWWDLLEKAGANFVLRVKPQSGHDTRWWPEEAPLLASFLENHPRVPLPDTLVWETGQTDRFNRSHWLVIDELGAAAGDMPMDSVNQITPRPLALGMGIRVWADAPSKGVTLVVIQQGSLAEGFGLLEGDIVRELGDRVVTTGQELQEAMEANAGESVKMVLDRVGHQVPLTVRLPPLPNAAPRTAFPHPALSGRVELERRGNLVTVRTRGVRRFTLLLSPDQFDFSQPIKVVTNGAESFEGRVTPTAATLLKWAGRDNDRTMLFGHELVVTLPSAPAAAGNR